MCVHAFTETLRIAFNRYYYRSEQRVVFGRWMRPLCNTGPQDYEGNPNGTATAVTSFVCGLEQRRALRPRRVCWEQRPNCVAHQKIASGSSDGSGVGAGVCTVWGGARTPCATSAAQVHGGHAGSSPGQTCERC